MITRRHALTLLASTFILPELIYSASGQSCSIAALFQGNPNTTIGAINVIGGFAMSRISGQTPAFVQVSAAGITATGTTIPYEDLEYFWNFGDATGIEIFIRPTDGISINANWQTGPEAAYCYRTAGVKTITLTVRGKNGYGYVTAIRQQTFTVSAYNASGGEVWFDSNYDGSNGAPNGTLSRPYTDSTTLSDASSTANILMHIKCDSVFNVTAHKVIYPTWTSPCRIDAYGTGAKPIVHGESLSATPANTTVYIDAHGGNPNDIVISDITFTSDGSGGAYTVKFDNLSVTGDTISNVYFDNCDCGSVLMNMGATQDYLAPPIYNVGWWGGTIPFWQQGSASAWQFWVGTSFPTAEPIDPEPPPHNVLVHIIYASSHYHSLYKWLACHPQNVDNCFRNNSSSIQPTSPYHLISECSLNGTDNGVGWASTFNNFVIEKCSFFSIYQAPLRPTALSITIRDCRSWNVNTFSWFGTASASAATQEDRIYRNRIYCQYFAIDIAWSDIAAVQQITDNIIWSAGTDATCADFQTVPPISGTIIDRNQYYAPDDSSSPKTFNAITGGPFFPVKISFADWQAAGFDLNGSYSNPGWTVPPTQWSDFGP